MAEDRPLNSDDLGDVGEKEFEQICSKAGMICNKAGRDRAGWDYVVEGKIAHDAGQHLDARQNPFSCLFQQKTMWYNNDEIKFRLSSLERLAKDPRPSFVYVLKMGNDLNPSEAYLLHMMDDTLAFVLGKLREEQAGGRLAVNKTEVRLRASKLGQRIELGGPALKAAIESVVNGDMHTYISKKKEKLDKLGFDTSPHELRLIFHIDKPSDMVDLYLGLKESVRVSQAENFETRFGITLKDESFPSEGEFRFKPRPVDNCTLTFRKRLGDPPVIFKAEAFFAPPLADVEAGHAVLLLKSSLFKVVVRKGKINFQTIEIDGTNPKFSIDEWISYFRLLLLLDQGNLSLDVQPTKLKRFTLKLDEASWSVDLEPTRFYLRAAQALDALCQMAGFDRLEPVSLEELVTQHKEVAIMKAFLDEKDGLTPLTFSTSDVPAENLPQELDGLYINYLRLGKYLVVMCIEVHATHAAVEAPGNYTSTKMNVKELEVMESGAYSDYIQNASALSGINFVFSRLENADNSPAGLQIVNVDPEDSVKEPSTSGKLGR